MGFERGWDLRRDLSSCLWCHFNRTQFITTPLFVRGMQERQSTGLKAGHVTTIHELERQVAPAPADRQLAL
jgi:hypothetical protein